MNELERIEDEDEHGLRVLAELLVEADARLPKLRVVSEREDAQ